MRISPTILAGLLFYPSLLIAPCEAQESIPRDEPKIHVAKRTETKQDLDHCEALKLYGIGVLHERAHRLLEAVRTFEQAQHLDPEAAPLYRALCPLYLALDRVDDALRACLRIVELEPGDYESWYLLAGQYRALERRKDAVAALDRARACVGLKERPELRAQICFDLGVLHENAQAYPDAENAYREVAAVFDNVDVLAEASGLSPEDINAQAAETYERLGRVCLKAGRHEAAITAFQTAQKKDPRRAARLAYNLAEVHQARGNLEEALKSLNTYLRAQPQGTEAYERRIVLLEKLGRASDILPTLKSAAETDKFNIGLQLLLAAQYAKRGQRQTAEEIYLSLLKTSSSPDIYRGLLALYNAAERGDMRKLLDLLDSAVKAAGDRDSPRGSPARAAEARAILQVLRDDPQLVGGLLTVIPEKLAAPESLDWQTRYYLAVLAARARKLNDAETLYRSCLSDLGVRHEHEAYSGLLDVLWQGHKHEAIVRVCNEGLQSAQGTSRVLFEANLAHAYMALDKPDQAVEYATHAADHAREEDRFRCRRLRAQVLAQAGRHEQAVQECQAMLKEYKQAKEARDIHYLLSTVYSSAKKSTEAEEQLQLILEQDPNDATANNDLGYMWADEGKNLAEAEKLIRKALALDQEERTKGKAVGADSDHENAAYIDSLGWVLFRRGQLAEARKQLEKAASLPDGAEDPVVWDHLGDACARQSDVVRARAAWQKAVELYDQGHRRKTDDRYPEIKQKLKLLK